MGSKVYRKRDKNQLTMEEFYLPFGNGLNADNRWVKMAKLIPWDAIEEIYGDELSQETGRPAISSRIAFGALYIKEQENLTDEGTVSYLSENPYAQYFVGLKEFRTEPLFDASMMVHFRKRLGMEGIGNVNEILYARSPLKAKADEEAREADEAEKAEKAEKDDTSDETNQSDHDDDNDDHPDAGAGEEGKGPKNKGVLILDATVAPADIHYPTDLNLLNECRENTERMIDRLWPYSDRQGHKTDYSRKKARQAYLKISKQRKVKAKARKRAVSEQIEYIGKNLKTLERLVGQAGENILKPSDLERLATIQKVYEQQKQMRDTGVRSVPDRIVNLRQPHIRCIVRGKAGSPYEFGQKLHLSVVSGFTFIEEQSYDNFNEGIKLQEAAERYKERMGRYPEAILADTIYRNKENRTYCKEHGIRLSGPKLGRPRKGEAEKDKQQAYEDSVKRSEVESKNGIAKRRYGLDLIMAYSYEGGLVEAALQILVMNVAHLLRFLLRLFGVHRIGRNWMIRPDFRTVLVA